MWIKCSWFGRRIIIDRISESRIINVPLASFNWSFWLALGLPKPCSWQNLGHVSSSVKLVKESCLPLEIILSYLWPLISAIITKSITKCDIGVPNLPSAHSGKLHKLRMMWPVYACMQSRKVLFLHVILCSTWGTSGTLVKAYSSLTLFDLRFLEWSLVISKLVWVWSCG